MVCFSAPLQKSPSPVTTPPIYPTHRGWRASVFVPVDGLVGTETGHPARTPSGCPAEVRGLPRTDPTHVQRPDVAPKSSGSLGGNAELLEPVASCAGIDTTAGGELRGEHGLDQLLRVTSTPSCHAFAFEQESVVVPWTGLPGQFLLLLELKLRDWWASCLFTLLLGRGVVLSLCARTQPCPL